MLSYSGTQKQGSRYSGMNLKIMIWMSKHQGFEPLSFHTKKEKYHIGIDRDGLGCKFGVFQWNLFI